jgi:hypothetical protein
MLIRGYSWRRELSADPVGRFGEHNGAAASQNGQGGSAAAETATNDHNIRRDFSRCPDVADSPPQSGR